MMEGMSRLAGACALATLVTACAHHGVVTHGSSVSWGPSRAGVLLAPAELPAAGQGDWIPPRWRNRGLRYGTDEMVSLIVHAGRELDRRVPGQVLGVADISLPSGGPSAWHRSHQAGRDVDLLLLARDADGRPVRTEVMHRFGPDGRVRPDPRATEPPPEIFFDDAANWAVVRTLLANPIAEVQYIFLSDDLKQRLLDRAYEIGEPSDLIVRASYLLHQPSDSLAHDDHMHVRIYCAPRDLTWGCQDFGVLRWKKRDYKYERRSFRATPARLLIARLVRPFRLMLALSAIPARGFVPRAP
jgi:penicillin-insensitive murein DD-endopeptidase